MTSHKIKIDDRIECDGFIGTVKFIGKIDDTDGEWIGIEWDDPNRGKHNGCVNGKQYFNTIHPKSGSMIRTHKLNTGKSLMNAMKERYADAFETNEQILNLPQKFGNDRSIEFIGFEKVAKVQSEFKSLKEVNLSGLTVAYCDDDYDEIRASLCHTEILILSRNLFTSWTVISKITMNMPQLSHLILSHNKLKVPSENDDLRESFACVKTLVLDNVDYDWDNVLFCASRMWPHIERLELWGNRIVTLKYPPIPVFEELNFLSLCNNKIGSWDEICKIGELPRLQSLNVSNCCIREIRFANVSIKNKALIFRELKQLFLDNNELASWRDIAELNKLQNLEDLVIKRNPIFECDKYEINFNFTLSKIGNLKLLNHEPVTPSVRKDAELYYMRHFFKDYNSLKVNNKNEDEFMNDHPRFMDIVSQYGLPNESEFDSKAEMDKKRFLTLTFRCPFADNKEITKKIPASISITNLKLVIKRLFNINFAYDMSLIWTSNNFECPLDRETQNLNFYSIENEDVIIVNINN